MRRAWTVRLVVLAVLVLLVEGAGRLLVHVGPARLADAGTGERQPFRVHRPDGVGIRPKMDAWLEAGEFRVRVRTDENGRRVSTRPPVTADSDLELIVVGDSVAFGWGVDDEETFGALLGERLGARVVNLGAPGTGLVSQRHLLEGYLRERSPGPAVVVWSLLLDDGFGGGNDLIDTYREAQTAAAGASKSPASAPPLRRSPVYRFKNWLSHHSVFYELTMRLAGDAVRRLAPAPSGEDHRRRLDEAWSVFGDELVAVQALLQEAAVPAVFGFLPYIHGERGADDATYQRLRSVWPEGLILVSFLDALHDDRRAFSFPRDGHPRAFGHERMADVFEPAVLTILRSDE